MNAAPDSSQPLQNCRGKIAIVVPDLQVYSGVPAVALYLFDLLQASGHYAPELLSISTSARDRNSIRLLSPATWFSGVRVSSEEARGHKYKHFGAVLTELEFQRYRPRRILTRELAGFDLVQIVAGTPPWVLPARDFAGPVALQVATLTEVERASSLQRTTGLKRQWLRLMSRWNRRLEAQALQRADVVLVENRWMHVAIAEKFGAEKVVFAPPGVDTDFFSPVAYRPHGHLLSVGRFADPRKNVELLIRAYAGLRARLQDCPVLVLAGETQPPAAALELATQLGVRAKIDIRTAVTREELRDLYCGASVFVLGSDEEGLGLVILEAMASGLPVVSTACGGPETAVIEADTGYLTAVGDVDQMTQRLSELYANLDLRFRLGARARARAVEQFSLAATGRVYLDTYERLLRR